ncbi:putative Protein kinase domain-containing protein [Seiridium cardinale]|uniref:Protein kinase domain-containing protein n=1 Tax=Seiridium cardinale TaxID=138064 RepID=A0ABR2XD28_9PEZI
MATERARRHRHREELQWLSYKFDRYREDGMNPRRAPTVGERRDWELPRPVDSRHGLQPAQGPIEYKPSVRPPAGPNLDKVTTARGLGRHARAVFDRLQDTHKWFNGDPWFHHPSVVYHKLLGYGASNLALHYTFGAADLERNFVLKVGLHDPLNDPRIRKEAKMLRKVRRSQHIVQALKPSQFGLASSTGPAQEPMELDDSSAPDDSSSDETVSSNSGPEPKRKRRDFTDGQLARKDRRMRGTIAGRLRPRDNRRREYIAEKEESPAAQREYLLLEYMENGTLEDFIWRLNELDQKCPNRVLWSFWVCLIRACIAMAYPVHKFHPRRKDATVTGALSESIPANHNKREWIRPMVHFAIDPTNVYIGKIPTDVKHDEHVEEATPILKASVQELGGFSVAEVVKKEKRNWYYESRRTSGKHGFFAPEQFSEIWDKLGADMDGPELGDSPIAGNYGPAMNIWGIATTLVCVITRCEPLMPPRAAKVKVLAREGDDSTTWWNHYSYGAMLVKQPDDEKWSYVDQELRETLAKCLARDPSHRPDLKTLLDQAVDKCEEDGPWVYADGESDADNDFVHEWMDKILKNAQPGQARGP